MLDLYKRFCCGLFYFFKEKIKSDIPFFASYMFILFLLVLVVYGLDSMIYLLVQANYELTKYHVYGIVSLFAIFNYFMVFKNKSFLKFYDNRLSLLKVLVLISMIFISCLSLILIAGVRNGPPRSS